MITVYALLGVIGFLCLLLAAALFVILRLVTHLSDKIAIPLYDAASKRTIIARPEPSKRLPIAPEDENLRAGESNTIDLDDAPEDELYKAITTEGEAK